jgi:hypothetical protein
MAWNDKENEKWMRTLKVGDVVAVRYWQGGPGPHAPRRMTVSRMLPASVEVAAHPRPDGYVRTDRFLFKHGGQEGHGTDNRNLRAWTDEDTKLRARENLLHKLPAYPWGTLTTEQLLKVAKALPPPPKKEGV